MTNCTLRGTFLFLEEPSPVDLPRPAVQIVFQQRIQHGLFIHIPGHIQFVFRCQYRDAMNTTPQGAGGQVNGTV